MFRLVFFSYRFKKNCVELTYSTILEQYTEPGPSPGFSSRGAKNQKEGAKKTEGGPHL